MTENQLKDIVRTNIRRYRDYRKWTQAEFAEKLSISINFLSDIENGKKWISLASMVKFASVLNLSLLSFLSPMIYPLLLFRSYFPSTITKSSKRFPHP